MAAIDQAELYEDDAVRLGLSSAVASLLKLHWPLIRQLFGAQLWRVWWAHRHERIKVEWWILRPSVKVGKLRKWVELALGPPPADIAKLISGES